MLATDQLRLAFWLRDVITSPFRSNYSSEFSFLKAASKRSRVPLFSFGPSLAMFSAYQPP